MRILFVLFCVITVVLLFTNAKANTFNYKRVLARQVARTASNEGALQNPLELNLIWQTVESRSSTNKGRLWWLRQHSGRVNGTKPCKGNRNCKWSRNLLPNRVPVMFRDNKLYWKVKKAPKVREIFVRAKELVQGAKYYKPCPIDPRTWGNRGSDLKRVKRMGRRKPGRSLFPINCKKTDNDGYAMPKDWPGWRGLLDYHVRW